jgi:peptidoglycan/xylan/chitin deacetylase (PgdA/CDA1 family)
MTVHRRPVGALAQRATRLRWRLIDAVAQAHRRVDHGAAMLTFDDGPMPGSTDRVLDVLAELDVKATFFCVGKNARAHPGLVRRIRAEGHAVGSHSYSHPHPRETALRTLARDYAQGRDAVAEALGEDTRLFRPPHGHLGFASAAVLRDQGLLPWLWSVDPEDWRPGATREHVTFVAGQAGAGDVVLLHDWIEQPWAPEALDRSSTVRSLPDIAAAIRGRGLVLKTLDREGQPEGEQPL